MSATEGGVWKMLTMTDKGWGGVKQMLTKLADKGGEGGQANADNQRQGG